MNKRYWYLLLSAWRKKGKDGLSIPYLIGSQHYLRDNSPMQTIEELITEIVSNNEQPIFMRYCFQIGDLILIKSDNPGGNAPSFRGQPQSLFFVSPFVDDLGSSIEELITILTDRYEAHIRVGDFSINDGKRGDFTPDEKKFINECFGN